MNKNDFNVDPNYNVDPNAGVNNFNSGLNTDYNNQNSVNNVQNTGSVNYYNNGVQNSGNANNYNTSNVSNMQNQNYYDTTGINNANNSAYMNPNVNNANGNYNQAQNQIQNQNHNPYFNNPDVVFEDRFNLTPEEKVKDFVSGLNKKFLMFIGGIVLGIIVLVLIIIGIVAYINSGYKAKVIIPDIVYMGEAANISVEAQGRKNLDLTNTKFEVSPIKIEKKNENDNPISKKTFYVLNESVKGKDVTNSIIPIQEGASTLRVVSTLDKKKLANVKKDVVVCPAFNPSLLLFKSISLLKETHHELRIEFGDEICGARVKYESSNPEIFTVDEKGKISTLKVGKAVLTITKDEVKSFKLLHSKLQLEAGDNMRLSVDYAPLNSTSGSIIFRSSDESVATVSDGGLVTAKGPGTAKITASMAPGDKRSEVTVTVVGSSNESDSVAPTEISLEKTEINLVQGNSEKILATVTPAAAKNKKLTWRSTDENIVTVDQNGVVLARNEGSANISVSTYNDIIKTIKVNVTKMKNPVVTASDKIDTNHWHTKPYALNFSGAANGLVYYYGDSESNMTNTGNKITISKDSIITYYVKACTVSCQKNCKNKKVDGKVVKDDDGKIIQECTNDCNPKPIVCSSPVAYVSKLDTTKPEVLAVVGIETSHAVKDDTVQIALRDVTSLIKQWCVTNVDSASTCKWRNIQSASNPVVNYTATYNDIYYVFAKDGAGNTSDSEKFEITNIE